MAVASSGFVPYGVGVGVYPAASSPLLCPNPLQVTVHPHQFPPSDGNEVVLHHHHRDPTATESYQNQFQSEQQHGQYRQHQNCSLDDISALVGIVDSSLSLSTQPMVAPVQVPDPVGSSVGPVSPMMWPMINDEDCAPSFWDYGDPFVFDFKGLID